MKLAQSGHVWHLMIILGTLGSSSCWRANICPMRAALASCTLGTGLALLASPHQADAAQTLQEQLKVFKMVQDMPVETVVVKAKRGVPLEELPFENETSLVKGTIDGHDHFCLTEIRMPSTSCT